MIKLVTIIFFITFVYSYGAGQTSNEVVVVGAFVCNYQGLEFAAAGELEKARRKFEEALHYMPYFAPTLLNLQICKDATTGIIEEKIAISLFKSLTSLSAPDSLYALSLANRAIQANPNYTPGYLCRARIYRKLSLYEKAQLDYEKAVKLTPMFALIYYLRGKLYISLEKYDKAVVDFTRLIGIDGSYAPAFLERGNAYCLKNEYDKAIKDYEIALGAWPRWNKNFKIFAAYLNRGIENIHAEKYQEALLDLNKAIELNTRFAEPFFRRGMAYLNLKSFDRAILDFNTAIERKPESAETYYNRGLALQNNGEIDSAIKDYLKAIALESDHQQAHYRLGEAYSKQKQFGKAIIEFDKVLALDPNMYWAYYWKALACEKLQNYQEAIIAYDAFLEKAPLKHNHHKMFAKERVKKLMNWMADRS